MSFESGNLPKIVSLYLKIRQYPTLRHQILERMREELFQRRVISTERFEVEIIERAIASQKVEGVYDPSVEEENEVWDERYGQVRDHLTEFYFAYNLSPDVFDRIVDGLLRDRSGGERDNRLAYNPEMAPLSVLLRDAERIEGLPQGEGREMAHHLQEIIVVIIKTIISDRLEFVGVAKQWLTVHDLRQIQNRRFGTGKIGGKAAGMLLAWKLLQSDKLMADNFRMPESYFIGTDVFDSFKKNNHLLHVMNQKYKSSDEIQAEFPQIQSDFAAGKLPESINKLLSNLLHGIGKTPLVVRSSSLLEDSLGTAFAGKYESVFCPNQGSVAENLERLTWAISQIYASVYSGDALIYRRRMGLLDYDERMAILLQIVEGERYGDFFHPPVSGVAFSRNPYRWTPRIRREDGLVRMVCGLGTRAVDRTDDFPRMVALSHPGIRPEVTVSSRKHYSQRMIDLINLQTNQFESHPIHAILDGRVPWLRMVASEEKDGYLRNLFVSDHKIPSTSLVLTFDQLIRQTDFVPLVKHMLQHLSKHYQTAVDVEFTVRIDTHNPDPTVSLCVVQCRPQSLPVDEERVKMPKEIPESDMLFSTRGVVTDGYVEHITFVVYVPVGRYESLGNMSQKVSIARVIGRLNQALEGERFILVGPNRWGSNNPELGVKVTYADVYNTSMLIEVAHGMGKYEPSYGTHFFQDLVEADIYPLAIYADGSGGFFQEELITEAPNLLSQLSPQDSSYADYVHVVNLPSTTGGRNLTVVMDAEAEESVGFLVEPKLGSELI